MDEHQLDVSFRGLTLMRFGARARWATGERAAELMEWAGALIPHIGADGGFDGPYGIFEVVGDSGRRMSAVIFHDFQPSCGTIQVSCASVTPYWASPNVLHDLLSYAFDTNGVRKLWMAIPHDSEDVISFNLHLGFKQDAILRYHFSETQHAVILSMLESEFRQSRWARKE